tara:strand:- start:123 stop:1358 length:1236 start_codon:yes stop_codon:yes gene_type:complete
MTLERRTLLKSLLSIGGAGIFPWNVLASITSQKHTLLKKDPHKVLHIHPQFEYSIVQKIGDRMSDKLSAPGLPDGMGCFLGAGEQVILMRNHEINYYQWHLAGSGPFKLGAHFPGGVTRLVWDEKKRYLVDSRQTLKNTLRNCAGGISPWGWLSCEETLKFGHGHVYLCPTDRNDCMNTQIINSYGRMNHEAVCIDPRNNYAYLTEDRDDSCFYRFVPKNKNKPFIGKLQALAIKDKKKFRTYSKFDKKKSYQVEWVDLDNQDKDDLRFQGQKLGAAVFKRGEGIFFDSNLVYFCCTTGGPIEKGQVFCYSPDKEKIDLVVQSEDHKTLNMPDNICLSPNGDLVIAEDGENCHIRVLTNSGKFITLAQNVNIRNEIAGVCFSPSGKTLFCNLQHEGITVALHGPFDRLQHL